MKIPLLIFDEGDFYLFSITFVIKNLVISYYIATKEYVNLFYIVWTYL